MRPLLNEAHLIVDPIGNNYVIINIQGSPGRNDCSVLSLIY